MDIQVTSSVFENEGIIPSKYTADGSDISPPLKWSSVPQGTNSIVLVSDDPDAPMGTWIHWVVWNIPPDKTELSEAVLADKALPDGSMQGITDFGSHGYGCPAPPSGTHRYYFKVYALDTRLELPGNSKKQDLFDEEIYVPTFAYTGSPNSFPYGPETTFYAGLTVKY